MIEGAYPKLITSTVDEIIKDIAEQTEQYIVKQLVSLDIDTDVLEKQAMEIQRLHDKLEKYRWIPVGERLPYSYVDVLCCLKNGHIVIGFADANSLKMKSYLKIYDENPIVAWMPLPEPYKEVEE